MYRAAKQNEDLTSIMMHNNQTAEFSEDGITTENWFTRFQNNISDHNNGCNRSNVKISTSESCHKKANPITDRISISNPKLNTPKRFNDVNISSIDNKKLIFISPKLGDFLRNNSNPQTVVTNDRNKKPQRTRHERYTEPLIRKKTISTADFKRKSSDWEPLSPNALAEYSIRRDAPGKGQFSHGRHTMWNLS